MPSNATEAVFDVVAIITFGGVIWMIFAAINLFFFEVIRWWTGRHLKWGFIASQKAEDTIQKSGGLITKIFVISSGIEMLASFIVYLYVEPRFGWWWATVVFGSAGLPFIYWYARAWQVARTVRREYLQTHARG